MTTAHMVELLGKRLRRQTSLKGSGRSTTMAKLHRSGVMLVAACTWVVTIAMAAKFGLADRDSSSPVSASDDFAVSAVGVADGPEPWALAAAESYVQWAGTPTEHEAAEVVVAFEFNGEYSQCMAQRGYSRPWQNSIAPPPVYKRPLLVSFWAAGPSEGAALQEAINYEVGQRQELAANSVEATGEEADAEADCREANPGASDDEIAATREPNTALLDAWTKSMQPVVEAGGWFDPWEACMTESGLLESLGVDSLEAAQGRVSPNLPVGSVPIGDEPSTPEWRDLGAAEAAYSSVDWACRRDVRASLGDEVEIAVTGFAAQHADMISRAREQWDEIVARAKSLGWSPADPLVGAEIPLAPIG